MIDVTQDSPAARGRRRGLTLERAIFDAVAELLVESGYDELSMGTVAARAGTSKPVLYRRWANRAELVIAAIRATNSAPGGPLADQGSLRADLIAMLRQMSDRMVGTPPEVVRAVRAGLLSDPELRAVAQREMGLVDVRTDMVAVLARAVERGEISAEPMGERVIRLPLDLMRIESFRAMPVPDEVVIEIVDQILLRVLAV
jgi:AcrR family transcriptional regulator